MTFVLRTIADMRRALSQPGTTVELVEYSTVRDGKLVHRTHPALGYERTVHSVKSMRFTLYHAQGMIGMDGEPLYPGTSSVIFGKSEEWEFDGTAVATCVRGGRLGFLFHENAR